jgi:hypothetical protein
MTMSFCSSAGKFADHQSEICFVCIKGHVGGCFALLHYYCCSIKPYQFFNGWMSLQWICAILRCVLNAFSIPFVFYYICPMLVYLPLYAITTFFMPYYRHTVLEHNWITFQPLLTCHDSFCLYAFLPPQAISYMPQFVFFCNRTTALDISSFLKPSTALQASPTVMCHFLFMQLCNCVISALCNCVIVSCNCVIVSLLLAFYCCSFLLPSVVATCTSFPFLAYCQSVVATCM